MSEPPWLDPEEDPIEPEPMLDWEAPRDPLASSVAYTFQKAPAPTHARPKRRFVRAIGWFILRFLAGVALMLTGLALWAVIFNNPRQRWDVPAFPTLIVMISIILGVATFLSVRFKWHGLVSGVISTLIAIVAIIIGFVLLVLYQCSHNHW